MTELWTATKSKLIALAIGIAIILAAIGLLELYHLFTLGAQVHWLLGAGLVLLALGLLTGLVIAPSLRFLRVPTAAQPPVMPASPSPDDLRRRIAYLERRFPALRESLRPLMQKADAAELQAFERDRVEPLLRPIDETVDAMIRDEALTIAFATAVSGNGALDAFVVFWRSIVLVSRIATAYYGRPGLRGTLLIAKDVAIAIAAARLAQTATDWMAKLLPTMLPAFSGAVLVPPILDGGFNLIMAMKVGHLAKRRCRSFEAWTEEERERSVVATLAFVASQAMLLMAEFLKKVGSLVAKGVVATAGAAVGAVGGAARGFWEMIGGWFGTRGDPGPAPA